jgi:DNA topoisomerase-1
MSVDDIDMEKALFLLSLPKDLGPHPELKKPVKLGIGRFGPYVVCDGDFRSIPKAQPLFDVNFDFAMQLLSQPKKGRGAAAPLKEFGEHPESGDKIQLLNGKYGPYIKCGKVNASVPEDMAVEAVTREKALELIEARGGSKKSGGKKGKKAASPKAEKTAVTKKEKPVPSKKVTAAVAVKSKPAPVAAKTIVRKKKS